MLKFLLESGWIGKRDRDKEEGARVRKIKEFEIFFRSYGK